jgi:hypothetical protein
MKVNPDNVDALDIWDKLSIYLKYSIIQICIKYSNINGNIWDIPTYSFSDFISTERKFVQDNGDDWQKNGWAQRHTKHYHGIYDFVERFDVYVDKR